MVSPYLERPVRTLDGVLEDRALVRPDAPRPASATPVGSPVDSNPDSDPDLDARRLDPIGILVRLLMSGHGAEGDDESAPVEAPVETPAAAEAASQPNGRRAAQPAHVRQVPGWRALTRHKF